MGVPTRKWRIRGWDPDDPNHKKSDRHLYKGEFDRRVSAEEGSTDMVLKLETYPAFCLTLDRVPSARCVPCTAKDMKRGAHFAAPEQGLLKGIPKIVRKAESLTTSLVTNSKPDPATQKFVFTPMKAAC